MTLQLISIIDSGNLNSEFKQLYEDAFPADERRSWYQLIQLFANPRFSFNEIYLHQKFIGFISVWNLDEFRFIEHFAICDKFRGKGFGSHALKKVLSQGITPVILEVEEITSEISRRRISFYEKLNFQFNDFEYYQPPYSIEKNKVKMIIISYPKKIESNEFEWIKNKIHKFVYKSNEKVL